MKPLHRWSAATLVAWLSLGAIACDTPETGDPLQDDPGTQGEHTDDNGSY